MMLNSRLSYCGWRYICVYIWNNAMEMLAAIVSCVFIMVLGAKFSSVFYFSLSNASAVILGWSDTQVFSVFSLLKSLLADGEALTNQALEMLREKWGCHVSAISHDCNCRHSVVLFFNRLCKIARNVGRLCKHRHGDAFFIHWQQYR